MAERQNQIAPNLIRCNRQSAVPSAITEGGLSLLIFFPTAPITAGEGTVAAARLLSITDCGSPLPYGYGSPKIL